VPSSLGATLSPLATLPASPSTHSLPLSPSVHAHAHAQAPLSITEPLLRNLQASQGTLWPAFSPFIRAYDLFVEESVTHVTVLPECALPSTQLVALVNMYAPFLPVTLQPGSVPTKIIVTFRPVGSTTLSKSQPLSTYEVCRLE
jgi:hypothetical protein